MNNLLWLVAAALLVTFLAGCGGLAPDVPGPATAAIAVIDALDAETNEPLPVEATAVVGGVRGTITLEEGSVVLRDVPFGSGTPPTQPLTVTAPGYVTFAEPIQISVTVVTFFTASLQPADPLETGTIEGTVVDDEGRPIVSALVKFTQVGPATTTEIRGYTDKDGVYKIGGIPIGVNTVTAEAEGFVTSTAQATVVQDQGGTNSPVNLTLLSGDTRLDVAGTVVNAFNDRPLAGAQVQFGSVATVTTDANGEFTISNVPVGSHVVLVTLTGFDRIQQEVQVLPGMGRLRFGMTSSAPEPPGGPYNLQGMVTLNGAPTNAGAIVTAVSTTTAREMARVTTVASGQYTMFLIPGEYRITASYGGRSVPRTVTVPGGGRVITGIDFVLTVDATVSARQSRTLALPRRK